MTLDEVQKFCIANAGAMASGVSVKDLKVTFRGRITGFAKSGRDDHYYILLEDITLKKKELPVPLPNIPYKNGDSFAVVSPCHMSRLCSAKTIKLEDTSSSAKPIPVPVAVPIVAQGKRACSHDCCTDPTWCYLKYTGLSRW